MIGGQGDTAKMTQKFARWLPTRSKFRQLVKLWLDA
jgi:hypothetical protein